VRRGCRQVVAARVFDAARDAVKQDITSVHARKM
jgi:hypothetical protein